MSGTSTDHLGTTPTPTHTTRGGEIILTLPTVVANKAKQATQGKLLHPDSRVEPTNLNKPNTPTDLKLNTKPVLHRLKRRPP